MGRKFSTPAIVFASLVGFVACENKQGGTGPEDGLQATFSSIQDNILTPKCVNAGCHPGGGAPMSLAKGVAYQNLVNVPSAYNMPRVDPSDANNSALYLKVIGDARTGGTQLRMPLGRPPLGQQEIDAIRDWINAGADNN